MLEQVFPVQRRIGFMSASVFHVCAGDGYSLRGMTMSAPEMAARSVLELAFP